MSTRAAATGMALLICAWACACFLPREPVPVPGDLRIRVATDVHTLLSQVEPVPEDDEERGTRLVEMFESMGCAQVERRPVDGNDLETVSCRLQGASDRTLVVAATFDEPLRKEAGDDWPSAALLPHLYHALGAEEREHSFEFVAFVDGKNRRPGHDTPGGVLFYLDQLPRKLARQTIAVVSLNAFGAGFGHGPIGVWEADADVDLYLDLRSVTKALDLRIRSVSLKKYPAGNPFAAFKRTVPMISLFVVDPAEFVGEYQDSYRIVSFYLGYVDQTIAIRQDGRASALAAAGPDAREGNEEREGADGPDPQDPGQHEGR